jgi:hypothetical protein
MRATLQKPCPTVKRLRAEAQLQARMPCDDKASAQTSVAGTVAGGNEIGVPEEGF